MCVCVKLCLNLSLWKTNEVAEWRGTSYMRSCSFSYVFYLISIKAFYNVARTSPVFFQCVSYGFNVKCVGGTGVGVSQGKGVKTYFTFCPRLSAWAKLHQAAPRSGCAGALSEHLLVSLQHQQLEDCKDIIRVCAAGRRSACCRGLAAGCVMASQGSVRHL